MSDLLRGTLAFLLLIATSLWYFTSDKPKTDSNPSSSESIAAADFETDNSTATTRMVAAHEIATNVDRPEPGVGVDDTHTDHATAMAAVDTAAVAAAEPNVDEGGSSGWFFWLKLLLFVALLAWLAQWLFRWLTGGSAPNASHSIDAPGMSRFDAELGNTFIQPPNRIDDLTELAGIDTAMAKRLNAAGIYQLDQLKNMTVDQRQALKRKFNLTGFDFGQLATDRSALGKTLTGTTEAGEFSSSKTTNGAGGGDTRSRSVVSRVDRQLGHVFTAAPSDPDDLTKLDGIDAQAAARLNDAGIYKFDQLAKMTASEKSALTTKCKLPKIDFDKWKLAIPAIGAGAAAIGAVASAATSAGSTVAGAASAATSAAASGATAAAKKAADAAGTAGAALPSAKSVSASHSTQQLASSTPKPRGVKADPDLGDIFLIPPKSRDDLTQLEGIDKDAAARLNLAGIYTFDQINRMSSQQRSNLKQRCKLPEIEFGKWSTAIPGLAAAAGIASKVTSTTTQRPGSDTAKPDTTTTRATLPVGAPPKEIEPQQDSFDNDLTTHDRDAWDASTRIDLDFGEVFINPPKGKNDLTRLSGVDADVAAKMNAAGIYKFEQLAALSPRQQASFKRRFGIPFGHWDDEFRTLAGVTAAPSTRHTPAKEQGGPNHDERRPIGFSATTANTTKTSPTKAGLAHKQQQQQQPVGPRSKDTARIDRELGFIYTTPPSDNDDLTRLAGIDATIAAKMNEAGIYKLDQLGALNNEQQNLLRDRLDLGDVDFADWRRCFYAWGRGIETSAEDDEVLKTAKLHGISLPQITPGIFDGEQLVAYPEQVVFRGSDPESWGRNVDEDGVKSISASAIRSDINYVRLRRCDTRESVVLPMTKSQLFSNGDPATTGWNGSAEMFYGGRHIGAFANDLPQEVETKFSQGGWGFGHRYDHNDRQEWGWAGRVIEPTTFEVSVGRIGEVPGTVVFRSSDPQLWNTRTREGEFRMADPISSVQHPINFVRIMRESTGEAVIVPVKDVLAEGHNPVGWNGANSHFSGANHLGAYHVDALQEVETRFGEGGWGFGHPFGVEDRQAWTWAGRELSETVFEISVLETVPEFLRQELI